MGIFSGKKKTYVSSVVYNMAGDEFKRPNYLRTTVIGAVLDQNNSSISDSISGSYLRGPAIKFRAFRRWADRTNYNDVIGLVTGQISAGNSIDADAVEGEITPSPGAIVDLQSATIGPADYTYWADQYVVENFPELINTEYVADINEDTNEITITWEDTTTDSFMPVNYEKGAPYLYAVYTEYVGDIPQDYIVGPEIDLFPATPFPSTVGWTEVSFSDDGMGTTHGSYTRNTFLGPVPGEDATYSLDEFMFQDASPTTKTYQIDTQEVWHSAATPMQVMIYKYGDGNAVLDAMFAPDKDMGGFYPVIPFRLNNKFVSEDYLPEIYDLAKKGYKKATTGKFDELVENLKDNPDLDDIDYTYVVFGACLNVMEQASRRYIYEFFKHIMLTYVTIGTPEYVVWQVQWQAAKDSWDEWTVWRTAQENPLDPLYGTTAPEKLPYPEMPANSLRVSTAGNPTMNYDMTISWNSIGESTGIGVLKPDAKPDQIWFTKGDQSNFDEVIWGDDGEGNYGPIEGGTTTVDELFLNWQIDENSWQRLRIVGLKHRNLIYGGKAVEITAFEAMDDAEEAGFIIPLHDGVWRSMGMKDATQMSTACCFMVFNCYQVVKQKWYQTTIFQIILVIIAIVIIVVTWGTATPAVAQAMAAYFTAIGFSVTMAAILAATIYVIGAMIVARLLTAGAVKLFGAQWGAVIGAILSVLTLQFANAVAAGASMATAFSGMMTAQNLMMLTSAVGDGYAAYMRASTMDLASQNAKVIEDYEKESRAIRQAWEDNLAGGGLVDPSVVTNALGIGVTMEAMDSFLQRTLMTGSDIADMSMSMLGQFSDMTLSTDLPT